MRAINRAHARSAFCPEKRKHHIDGFVDIQSTPQDVQNYDSQERSEPSHVHAGSGEESLAFLATIDKHVADAVQSSVSFTATCILIAS